MIGLKIITKTIKWIVGAFFASTILAVVAYRFVPVYVTPLMLIRVVTGKMSQSHRVRNLLTPMMAYEKFFNDSQINAVRSHLQKCNINEYFTSNLKYDSIRSNAELSSQIALIAAKCGQVKKGERIIDRGDID